MEITYANQPRTVLRRKPARAVFSSKSYDFYHSQRQIAEGRMDRRLLEEDDWRKTTMTKRLGIVQKMVIGITGVSTITYATSALFLLVLKDKQTFLPGGTFVALTLALGIFWTGFLGYLAARWFVKPLLALTKAAREAASGNLEVSIATTDNQDEIQALNRAFSNMIEQLRGTIAGVAEHSKSTDAIAGELQQAIDQAPSHIVSMTEEVNAISE